MQKDTTKTDRRKFLLTSGMAGAALVSSPLIGPLAQAQPVTSLQPTEITVAVELLTEIRQSQRSGLLLLIVEHIGIVAATGTAQDVEKAINVIRGELISRDAKDRDASLEALRSETHETLRAAALEAADSN